MLQLCKKYITLIHDTEVSHPRENGEACSIGGGRLHLWSSRPFGVIVLSLLCILLGSSCTKNTAFDQVYTVVQESTLQTGTTIPQPEGEVILTVSGKIGTTNADNAIVMDRSMLEAVGLVEYHVQDPFANHDILYRGVLMRDLLKLWQMDEEVKVIRFIALNDYQIDIPVEDFSNYPVLFALQADGVYMEPDYQGPAMLVYPLDNYDFDLITIKRRWIWQIKRIELE